MSTRGDILRRAAQVEPDAVPEPWRVSDDEDALATVSDREHYRKNLVTLPDGAGEVPAYVWDFPRTPTIPDEVREEWTRGSAGRVLGPNGKYVSRGSDVPRLSFDGDPGLLVEAAGRTNQVTYSSDFDGADWSFQNDVTKEGELESLINGENASTYSSTAGFQILLNNAGTTTGNDEVVWGLFYQQSAEKFGFGVRQPDASNIAEVVYDWATDSLSGGLFDSSARQAAHARRFNNVGPNGEDAVEIIVRYNETSGLNRQVLFRPDNGGDGNTTSIIHAQLEEAPNASSPIVTGGSPTTRSGDAYNIFSGGQPEWWNENEGTFIMHFKSLQYKTTDFNRILRRIDGGENDEYITLKSAGENAEIGTFDNDTGLNISNAAGPFKRNKVAISFTRDRQRLSANGESNSGPHNGSYLRATRISVPGGLDTLVSVSKLLYVPRALSESTLNAITS